MGRQPSLWEEEGSGQILGSQVTNQVSSHEQKSIKISLSCVEFFLSFVACRLICVTLITDGQRREGHNHKIQILGFFMLQSGRWEGSPLSTSLLLQIPPFQNFILAFRVDTAYTEFFLCQPSILFLHVVDTSCSQIYNDQFWKL